MSRLSRWKNDNVVFQDKNKNQEKLQHKENRKCPQFYANHVNHANHENYENYENLTCNNNNNNINTVPYYYYPNYSDYMGFQNFQSQPPPLQQADEKSLKISFVLSKCVPLNSVINSEDICKIGICCNFELEKQDFFICMECCKFTIYVKTVFFFDTKDTRLLMPKLYKKYYKKLDYVCGVVVPDFSALTKGLEKDLNVSVIYKNDGIFITEEAKKFIKYK